jgi:hypothetical protein
MHCSQMRPWGSRLNQAARPGLQGPFPEQHRKPRRPPSCQWRPLPGRSTRPRKTPGLVNHNVMVAVNSNPGVTVTCAGADGRVGGRAERPARVGVGGVVRARALPRGMDDAHPDRVLQALRARACSGGCGRDESAVGGTRSRAAGPRRLHWIEAPRSNSSPRGQRRYESPASLPSPTPTRAARCSGPPTRRGPALGPCPAGGPLADPGPTLRLTLRFMTARQRLAQGQA